MEPGVVSDERILRVTAYIKAHLDSPLSLETLAKQAADNQFGKAGYQHAGDAPTYAFDINVSVAAGMKIQQLDSPSHTIKTAFAANNMNATVALAQVAPTPGAATGNKDFVLRYRLAGDDISSGLLLFPGAKENFFLMMVQPPRRPALEQIPPREYVFIIDVSGSGNRSWFTGS